MKGTIKIEVPKYILLNFDEKTNIPIREKKEIINLIILSSEIILEKLKYKNNSDYNKIISNNKIIFVNKKMRRLFYKCDNKFFSISSPFFIRDDNLFNFFNKNKVTKEILSALKYINSIYSDLKDPLDIYENDEGYPEEILINSWKIYSQILLSETGYIRYDYDEKHENKKLHPLNHLDIFYESNSTFKIGLKQTIEIQEFINLLDIETDCKYLD